MKKRRAFVKPLNLSRQDDYLLVLSNTSKFYHDYVKDTEVIEGARESEIRKAKREKKKGDVYAHADEIACPALWKPLSSQTATRTSPESD